MKSRSMNFLKLFIGWPISIVSLFFIFKILAPRWEIVFKYINRINIPILLLSLLCFFTYFFLRGLVWKNILKAQRYEISFKRTLPLWCLSELKRYTPGNIWSFIGRILSFEKLGVKKKDSTKALIIEGELVVLAGLVGFLIALPFIFRILPDFKLEIFAQPLIFVIVFAIISLYIFNVKFFKKNLTTILPRFNYVINFKLLTLSFLALLFFGLGTYFSTASIFYLNSRDILLLSGFFIFSLLIGYITIVTPTGLGIREGVITWGLLSVLPLTAAGFSAIFARVIFILSEIIFLGFVLTWNKSKNMIFLKIEKLISQHLHISVLLLLVLIYIIYFTTASFLRHDNFFTGRFDLGNMDQTVWNTMRGRIFSITDPNGTDITSRLSFHADFILILISPLYFLWKDPKMLLLLQTVILSLGSIFIYLISMKILKNKNISLVLSVCYLLNPAVNHSNLYDFHPVVLATTFLLAAYYFMIKNKNFLFVLFLILASLTKEQVWLISSIFGIYLIAIKRKKLFGLAVLSVSLFIFYILIFKAIPNAAGGKSFALSYYSDFGDSPGQIIKNVIINPVKTFSVILNSDQLIYLKNLLFPLAFFPLFSIVAIFALPDLLLKLLASNRQLHAIYYQYSATITPFLFIATIYSIKTISKYTPNLKVGFFSVVILAFSLYSAYDFGPLPGAKDPNIKMFTNQLQNRETIDNFLQRIPRIYSISTTNNLGAHLSHRQKIYTLPAGIDKADYVLFLLKDPTDSLSNKEEAELVEKMEKNLNYQKVFVNGSFVVFKKKILI